MSHILYRIGNFSGRHPWRVISAWILAAVAIFMLNGSIGGAADESFSLPGAESQRAADAVVVVRTADPQSGETAPFVKGLYEGLADAGVPTVGVGQSKSEFAARTVFQQAQLSTVDDVDLDAGKLALAIVLSTPASRADYGISAPDLLPPVTPVLTPSG